MTDQDQRVKRRHSKFMDWGVALVDRHPRTGWYVVLLLAANYLIDFLQLFH